MKVIIAGCRHITDSDIMVMAIEAAKFETTEVVSGAARGVDRLGEEWAFANKVPTKRFPADWDKYGKAAGRIRNREMAEYADALIAVWDGQSHGTMNMIDTATRKKLRVFVWRTDLDMSKVFGE